MHLQLLYSYLVLCKKLFSLGFLITIYHYLLENVPFLTKENKKKTFFRNISPLSNKFHSFSKSDYENCSSKAILIKHLLFLKYSFRWTEVTTTT